MHMKGTLDRMDESLKKTGQAPSLKPKMMESCIKDDFDTRGEFQQVGCVNIPPTIMWKSEHPRRYPKS